MPTQQRWYAMDIRATAASAEAIESAFNVLDSIGTEINNLGKGVAGELTVTGYFVEPPDMAAVGEMIDWHLEIYGLGLDAVISTEIRTIENQDWLTEWKRHWRQTHVGKFIIAPPWSVVEEVKSIVIRIEPNMAFGTGTHETTKLCLEAISRFFEPNESFLDIGTGTGILAIAAAKLSGSSKITAYETDADSVVIARENAIANGVGDSIELIHATIADHTCAADFVCANVTLDVIGPMLPLLISKTRHRLVLSGILVEQRSSIEAELATCGIAEYEIETDGEWISVIVLVA
jgi:ribosomal protein L11 methyltransferase